jgi:hypothetical protein
MDEMTENFGCLGQRSGRLIITFSLIYLVLDTDQACWLSFVMFVEFISKSDGCIRFFLGQAAIRDQKANSVYSILLTYHFGALSKCCGVLNESSKPKIGRDQERSMAEKSSSGWFASMAVTRRLRAPVPGWN